jgi:hypothetical protein
MVIHRHGDRSVFLDPRLVAPERIDAIRAGAKDWNREPLDRLVVPVATVVRRIGESSPAAALPR